MHSRYLGSVTVLNQTCISASAFVSDMPRLCHRLGARNIISITLVPYALASGIIFFATSFPALFVGRLLISIIAGLPLTTCMGYVSSTSSPRYRGAFSVLVDVIVVTEIIGAILLSDFVSWWWMVVICGASVIIPSVILLYILPSDPVWLLRRGKLAEARLSADYFDLDMQEDAIHFSPQNSDKSFFVKLKTFTERKNLQPLAIVLMTFLCSAFCGNTAIINHSLVFFQNTGMNIDASLSAVLFSGFRVLGTILSVLLVDRFGRRALLLASSGGMVILYAVLAAYYQVPALQTFPILPIVVILASSCTYAIGVGCVPWCLQGEIFPIEIRQFGGCLVPASYSLFSYASIFTLPKILAVAGETGLFLFYGSVMAAFFIFELMFVPETKQLTLAQIETLFVKDDKEPPDNLVEIKKCKKDIGCVKMLAAPERAPSEHMPHMA